MISYKTLLLSILTLLTGLLLGACTKNEVKITFQLPAEINSPCRIVYYASGKNVGMIRETAAEITGGKGELVLPLRYPAVIYLFSSSRKTPSALVYAERGQHLKVTGSNSNVEEWKINGNPTTDLLTEWRLSNSKILRQRDADTGKVNKAVEEFVKANPDSPAAAIILYHYFVRNNHEKEFFSLQKKLGRKILDNQELMSALSMPDLMTNLPDSPSLPRQIVLTGEDGFADTLDLGKGKGMLLMFRNGDSSQNLVSGDSIKALAAKRKDRILAELFVDTDSLGWRRHLRKDTVPDMKRLWLPLGTADTLAIKMGIRKLPYFLVINPKGKETYRGTDWDEAVKKFESLKP